MGNVHVECSSGFPCLLACLLSFLAMLVWAFYLVYVDLKGGSIVQD